MYHIIDSNNSNSKECVNDGDDILYSEDGICDLDRIDDGVDNLDRIDDGVDNLDSIDDGFDGVQTLDGINNEGSKKSSTFTFLLTLIGKIIVHLLKFIWLFIRAAFQIIVFGITHPKFTMTLACIGVALYLLLSSSTSTDDGKKDTTTAPMATSFVNTTPLRADVVDHSDEVFKG